MSSESIRGRAALMFLPSRACCPRAWHTAPQVLAEPAHLIATTVIKHPDVVARPRHAGSRRSSARGCRSASLYVAIAISTDVRSGSYFASGGEPPRLVGEKDELSRLIASAMKSIQKDSGFASSRVKSRRATT